MTARDYTELRIQKYLEASWISKDQARLIFKFRTKMAPFDNNFRGGREEVMCPICKAHPDDQTLLLKCPAIKNIIHNSIDMENINSDNILRDTVDTLVAAMRARENLLDDKQQNLT